MTKKVNYYSIVHYVPDPIRDERINIGVIVVDDENLVAYAKFLPNFSRAKQFGHEDITFLIEFAQSVELEIREQKNLSSNMPRWNINRLKELNLNWNNSIQISQMKVSTLPINQLINKIYSRFIEYV